MYNMVELEYFAVASAKRIAAFPANLKLVRTNQFATYSQVLPIITNKQSGHLSSI